MRRMGILHRHYQFPSWQQEDIMRYTLKAVSNDRDTAQQAPDALSTGYANDWEESRAAVHLGWDSAHPGIDAASDPDAAWKRRHPGELPPWERFIDAVRHGWCRMSAGMDCDEADYRIHHADHYPDTDYNDLAPVYRYGSHVRDRAAFRGRDWNDVEGELRIEWERGCKEGKPSTWDEMKAALQQGWKHGEE